MPGGRNAIGVKRRRSEKGADAQWALILQAQHWVDQADLPQCFGELILQQFIPWIDRQGPYPAGLILFQRAGQVGKSREVKSQSFATSRASTDHGARGLIPSGQRGDSIKSPGLESR
jgi:hypothetical protein